MAQMQQGVLFRWRDEFASWLKPEWVELLHRCMTGGVADFDNPEIIPPRTRLLLSARSATSIRHDFIVAHFEAELVGVPELRLRRYQNHVLIWIADEAVATIKKIGEKTRLAMPNKTRQSYTILSDAPTLVENMPPKAQQIVIGYTVNDTETEFTYYITAPSQVGNDNHWEMNLANPANLIILAAPEVEAVETDELPGRVGLSEAAAKRVAEIEEQEAEEERREADDSAR